MRWWLGGTGALKRGTDRVEAVFRLLLVIAVVTAVPIGIRQTIVTYDHQGGISRQQAREHRPVQAVVDVVPPLADDVPPDVEVSASVSWTAPDGTPAGATVPVFSTTRPGDRITLWVAPDGRLTGPPAERQRHLPDAVWAGALAGLTVPVAGWGLLGLARLVLDARRSRQWQREWLTVEPEWRSRRS